MSKEINKDIRNRLDEKDNVDEAVKGFIEEALELEFEAIEEHKTRLKNDYINLIEKYVGD